MWQILMTGAACAFVVGIIVNVTGVDTLISITIGVAVGAVVVAACWWMNRA